jgi:hypothetical protein
MDNGPYMAPLVFMNKMAILAGKVVDRNQSVGEQSFAWALQLDQELEDLWKRLDPAWLEYSELLADVEKNAAELRERLMAQIMYYQIRVYLHLPFMLKSQSNPRFTFSRNACVNGSREVLRLYQDSRIGEVQPLYECKAIDFIGFTAAVLVMVGLFNFGGTLAPQDQEQDIRLIERSVDIFRRASSEKGGKVALQSAEVLERMLMKFKSDWGGGGGAYTQDDCRNATDFVIPYFGTISIRRGPHKAPCPAMTPFKKAGTGQAHKISIPTSTTSPSQITPSSEATSSDLFSQNFGGTTTPASSTNSAGNGALFTDPFVSYDGFYNWPASHTDAASTTSNPTGNIGLGGTQINDDSMNNFPLPTNNFSWQNMPMDIDQDWSWFLNDAGTAAAAQNGLHGGQVGDAFSQQTYAGFG